MMNSESVDIEEDEEEIEETQVNCPKFEYTSNVDIYRSKIM
jgi:precorrin-6B methylase 2